MRLDDEKIAATRDDLTKRLEIKADMLAMGERIAFGSDSAIMRQASDTIRALATEVLESRAAEERWRSNSRETFDAMVAMRNDINEHIPLPSIDSDLARGPGNDVFCAEVAQGVVTALVAKATEIERLTKERDEAREQIIETMARAADPLAFVEGSPLEDRGYALDEMRRALSALEAAGLVLVPVDPTDAAMGGDAT